MTGERKVSPAKLLANANRADVAYLAHKEHRDALARERSEAITACRAAGLGLPTIADALTGRGERVTSERVRQMEAEGKPKDRKISLAPASDSA